MNKKAIHSMLSVLIPDYKVYPDFVPEKAVLPALSYQHLNNNRTRPIDGVSNSEENTWRVSVITKSREDADIIRTNLESLDGMSNNDFQSVFVISVNDEPKDPRSGINRVFLDLKTFDK